MAALPAGALSGTGQKPTGADAQGGGLQSQTAGGHPGMATDLEKSPLNRMKERMKNEKLDDLENGQSMFAAARRHRDHSLSKTTPFADISIGIAFIPTLSLPSTKM